MARGVAWGVAILAAALFALPPLVPAARDAWRLARLSAEDPPTRLRVPVQGVEPGQVGDTWGDARSGGRRHEGVDIFARRNTPVVSATRGVVVRVGENALGGRTVTVLGPGGWRHYYAHLEKWAGRERGDWVEAGAVIGFVGTTGNAPRDAPHLHYGVYTREGPINPYALLTAPPDSVAPDTARPPVTRARRWPAPRRGSYRRRDRDRPCHRDGHRGRSPWFRSRSRIRC